VTYRLAAFVLVVLVATRSSRSIGDLAWHFESGRPHLEAPAPLPPPVHIDTSLATMLADAPRLTARAIDASELGRDVRVYLVEQFGPARDSGVTVQVSRVLVLLVGAGRSLVLSVGLRFHGADDRHPAFGTIEQIHSSTVRGEAQTFFEGELPAGATTLLYAELFRKATLTSSAYGIARANDALYVWSGGNDMRVVKLAESAVVRTPSDSFTLPTYSPGDPITMHEMVGAKNSIEIAFTAELAVGARRGPLLAECIESVREGVGLVGWQHDTTGASFGHPFQVLAWRDCHAGDETVSFFLRRVNGELQLQRIGDGQVVFEHIRIDPGSD
jgi:hypothetical protein